MPKISVSDWDETAANNTDINGLNIADNSMETGTVDNAVRDLMAQIATALGSGNEIQPYHANLASLSGLTFAANKGLYTTAANTAALYDLTTAGLALLDDADASAQRTTLGLGTAAVAALIDEDDMASDDATALPSQQSVKAYVDAQAGAGLQWTESFTTAKTTMATIIPLDNTAPTTSEGTEIASIGSVVVASGDQVEINVDVSAFNNDDFLIMALFRDSTCIAARVGKNASTFASQYGFTYVDDDPGAGTYTYSLRVGNNNATTYEINSQDASATQQFTTATMKSGMRLRVLS